MTPALVFARMDSQRLPGKVLADLGGKPMLDRVVDRVSLAARIGTIVIATTDRPVDDPVAERASFLGVGLFRGATEDVVGRALACAAAWNLDAVLRISGDSPFVAPEVIDSVSALYEAERPDVATNVHPRSYPPGCSAEMISVEILAREAGNMSVQDREHVTTYFYRNADHFRIANLKAESPFSGIRLTVDTEEELSQARWMVAQAGGAPERLGLEELVALASTYGQARKEAAP